MKAMPPYVEAKDYIRAHATVRGQHYDIIVLGWRGDRIYLTWRTDMGRHLGWVPAVDVERCSGAYPRRVNRPFLLASERDGLSVLLDQQREALIRKMIGVTDADARRRPTASALSLLSLLKHCTVWEVRWCQAILAGARMDDGWPDHEDDDAEFRLEPGDTLARWLRRYEEACAASRAVTADADLDGHCARPDVIDCNVRWVLLHLIEETARHAGHADIIREAIDGTRGM